MKARVVRRWAGSLIGVALLAASGCSGSEPADPEPSSAVSESASESAGAADPGARFLDGGSGHGYELLGDYTGRISRVGRTVLAFAKG